MASNVSTALQEVKPHVLLVEDSRLDAEIVIRKLRRAGSSFRVQHVLDGFQALLELKASYERNQPPVAILLDIHLPGMSGWQVIEHIRATDSRGPVPILVMTSSPEDVERVGRLAGPSIVALIKPVDDSQILEALGHLGIFPTQNGVRPLHPWGDPAPKSLGPKDES